ncbi:hypothetical protein BGW80DRAFT_1296985 [Lactifluus volemus]|nr:hypothetical protein BGW80DRAFT_1296985 [Lactifluus volemus]
MLALQGTLRITSYCSSMDEQTLKSDHVSPLGHGGQRARAPTPPRRPSSTLSYLPSLRSDLGGARSLEHSQSRSHPGRPSSTHPHAKHTPSPVPSSSSSGFTHSHVQEQIQDRPQRARTRDSAGDAMRARTSTSSPYPTSLPSQERVGKRKRPASAERNTPVPRTAATHRDSVGPQRSHRRHHNVAEKTHATLLPSGGMYMTFPLDIPSPEPDTEGAVKAGPSPFEHGPTELPPRPYEKEKAEPEVGGPERPGKKGRLPADVMDHLPAIEGRLHKIEVAVQDFVDTRNKRALEKSMLPGSSFQ